MIDFGFNDSTSSNAEAERADIQEALLRGELSRKEYNYLLSLIESRYDEQ